MGMRFPSFLRLNVVLLLTQLPEPTGGKERVILFHWLETAFLFPVCVFVAALPG